MEKVGLLLICQIKQNYLGKSTYYKLTAPISLYKWNQEGPRPLYLLYTNKIHTNIPKGKNSHFCT